MRIINVFEDLEPTYAELSDVLIKLGFRDHNTDDLFRFYNKAADLMILLPAKKLHEKLDTGRFGAVSSQLEHFGIIDNIDDLGKMIKQKRLAIKHTA